VNNLAGWRGFSRADAQALVGSDVRAEALTLIEFAELLARLRGALAPPGSTAESHRS
jgi:hypothetical protein